MLTGWKDSHFLNKTKMKYLIILSIIFFSCKKDVELITPHYDYSARITAPMTDKTMSFNIFVKVDSLWIFLATKTKSEIENNKMGFNIPYFVCNGITYPHGEMNKAAIIERYSTGNYNYAEKALDSTHVQIIKN